MTATLPSFLGRLDSAAKAAQAAEIAYRQSVTEGIARHERQRQFAFRRLSIARTLSAAVAGTEEEQAAVDAGTHALRRELDWFSETPARSRILEAFRPVVLAAWTAGRAGAHDGAHDGTHDGANGVNREAGCDPAAFEDAFADFECWYEGETGSPFLALLDQEIPETPLVEF